MSRAGRRRGGLRRRLWLLSLTLLAIPWAGILYLNETETLLRRAQQQLLADTARSLAALLRGQPELAPPGMPAGRGALYVHPAPEPLQLDGYGEEWQALKPQAHRFGGEPPFELLLGERDATLYLLLEVDDPELRYPLPRPGLDNGDRVELLLGRGEPLRLRFATPAPGWVVAQRADGTGVERSVRGEWQERPGGYTLELRLPRTLIGGALGVRVIDADPEHPGAERVATSDPTDEPLALVAPSPVVGGVIATLEHPNARIWVVDRGGRVLARRGSLHQTEPAPPAGPLDAILRRLLPAPSETFVDPLAGASRLDGAEVRSALAGERALTRRRTSDGGAVILSAVEPVRGDAGVIGAVIVERTTNPILSLQHAALKRLLAITLLLFMVTSLLLLGFASLLTRRIRRLRDAIDGAVAADGRIIGRLVARHGDDEIGDLGRGFTQVLDRLAGYNRYLEAMGSRLTHELRTPLTVVTSSLDNLAEADDPAARQRYLERARDGTRRLGAILTRLGEATRLERALAEAELEPVELGALIASLTENYRQVFRSTTFVTRLPQAPLVVRVAADLLAQSIDKLVANAVDFHRPETPIELTLAHLNGGRARIEVVNIGPPLPAGMEHELFASMVSLRAPGDGEPHLGLGLYLVRLIAEFHHGRCGAENRRDAGAVAFWIELAGAGAPPPDSASPP